MIRESTANGYEWTGGELQMPGRGRTFLALAMLLGVALGTGVSAFADEVLDEWRSPAVAEAPAREWRRRPIPLEWRWSPPTVKVDHMFRKRR